MIPTTESPTASHIKTTPPGVGAHNGPQEPTQAAPRVTAQTSASSPAGYSDQIGRIRP